MKNITTEFFVNKWWSTPTTVLSPEVEEWMANSHADPEQFLKEVVFALQEHLLPTSQSIFGKSYNFYHDCVLRHVKSNNTALSIVKEKGRLEHWSYEKLHHCVNFHVDKWSYHSPQSGQTVAIVAPPGLTYIVSLLTALRFGLKICYLPTNSPFLGRGYILEKLSEIKPDLIAAEDHSIELEGVPTLLVNEKGLDDENHNPHSFAYPSSEPLFSVISLHNQEPLDLATLDTHYAYLLALRDGLLTFNLIQHPYWAFPLNCPISSEPTNALMSLLCGTTRIYVPDEIIRKDPFAIQDERINLLGLSSEMQKLWKQFPGVPVRYLKTCYRYPFDINYDSWKTFIQINKLEKIPVFHLLMDSSLGGACLVSKPTTEIFNFFLKPSLGSSYFLSDITRGEKTLTGFGTYNAPLPGKEEVSEGNLTATQIEKNLMLTGTVEPARESVTFPILELEEVAGKLSFIEGCMLHSVLKMGSPFSKHFILLVFVSPMKKAISDRDKELWSTEICQAISSHLGSGFLPDQIDYFPLLPKTNTFGINRNWCANQYDSGLLAQKKDLPQYQTLTILKKLVQTVSDGNP